MPNNPLGHFWLLEPIADLPSNREENPWVPWYDKCFGMVIYAETEEQAREIAHANGHDEIRCEPQAWTSPAYSTCVPLDSPLEPGVIVQDVRWG